MWREGAHYLLPNHFAKNHPEMILKMNLSLKMEEKASKGLEQTENKVAETEFIEVKASRPIYDRLKDFLGTVSKSFLLFRLLFIVLFLFCYFLAKNPVKFLLLAILMTIVFIYLAKCEKKIRIWQYLEGIATVGSLLTLMYSLYNSQ